MKRFKNILYVLNIEQTHESVMERVVTLAENNQARLKVVSIHEPVTVGFGMPEEGPISIDLQAAMVGKQTQKLEAAMAPYCARVDIQTQLLVGTQFLEIIREVLRNGHDLVIKVPESLDWLDQLFGSEDMHLLRKCPCPVWLIKPVAQKTYQRILAAVDVDDTYAPSEQKFRNELNQQIMELASSMALSGFAELHVVYAWEAAGKDVLREVLTHMPEEKILAYIENERQKREAGMKQLMLDVSNKLGQETFTYLKPRTHLVKGHARKEIPELARQIEADLIVMGTVARTGVAGFIIGNTAEAILNQIECSVLALKPPGFVTPVKLDD
jgi:nucleotide-binding universal stress UspA family protein